MMSQQLVAQRAAYNEERKASVKNAAYSTERTLGEQIQKLVGLGIEKAAERCRLTIPEGTDKEHFEFLGADSKRFANRPTTETGETFRSYEGHLRQFWQFAAMKGDYESMLMLLTKPPAHFPSIERQHS